jgi:hypothetical protein
MILVVAILATACNPMRGCQESFFTLAPQSRLPRWFTLPTGLSRGDVKVTLSYYSAPWGSQARIILWGPRGEKLADVTGSERPHPSLEKKRNQYDGFDPGTRIYTVVTVNGTSEVVEYPLRDGQFAITDDPALTQSIGSP